MSNTELRVVQFHGDEIVTFECEGAHFVAMRRIVENMGLDWARQSTKLSEQKDKFNCCPMPTVGADGKIREMLAMPVEKLQLWLASINPNKITNEVIRAKVERYQAESAIALHDYWTKGAAFRDDFDGMITSIAPGVMNALGGMMKGVMHKQVALVITQLVEAADRIAVLEKSVETLKQADLAPTFDFSATMTADQIIESAGIKREDRVKGTAAMVTHRMTDFCEPHELVRTPIDLNPRRPWRFPKLKAHEWLFGGNLGAEQIRNQMARVRGLKARRRAVDQTSLRLVPPAA